MRRNSHQNLNGRPHNSAVEEDTDANYSAMPQPPDRSTVPVRVRVSHNSISPTQTGVPFIQSTVTNGHADNGAVAPTMEQIGLDPDRSSRPILEAYKPTSVFVSFLFTGEL